MRSDSERLHFMEAQMTEEFMARSRRRHDDTSHHEAHPAHTPTEETADLSARLNRVEEMMAKLLEISQSAAVKGQQATPAPLEDGRPVHQTPIRRPVSDSSLAPVFRGVPEPRRQRKERHMPARKLYRSRTVRTTTMMHAIQELTPAATAIIVYLATHPAGATVMDLVAQLDLKRKTVENLLSILKAKELITVENV